MFLFENKINLKSKIDTQLKHDVVFNQCTCMHECVYIIMCSSLCMNVIQVRPSIIMWATCMYM